MAKSPHLRDLFHRGEEITLTHSEAAGIKLWVQKPSAVQQEMASRRARGKKTRRRAELLNPQSDERMALVQEVEAMDLTEIVKEHLNLKRPEFQQQAVNEIMFNPEVGSNWGKEGEKYADLLDALLQRTDEIIAEAGEDGSPDFEGDEEFQRLAAIQDTFEKEVTDRIRELMDDYEAELVLSDDPKTLRKDYITRHIANEADFAWFVEYRTQMLYYSCRDPEDHNTLYFEDANEVLDLPLEIQQELYNMYDRITKGAEELKNSLTPQSS